MANEKQCGLLAHKAKQAGVEWKYTDGSKMNNEEVTAKLEEFAKIEANAAAKEAEVVDEPRDIDRVRFGLACKVVLQKMPHFEEVTSDNFAKNVKTVYDLMSYAEKKLA